MEGTGEVAWMPVPSQHWAYAGDLVPTFEYDPEGARALLEEAGYGDGFTITMTSTATPDAVRRAEIVQAQLAEIGITVEITPEQTVDSVQRFFEAKQVDAYNSSMTSRPDPSITYQTMFSADSFYNTAQTSPEDFEELLRAAREAQTTEERRAAFEALDEAAIENALWVPLVFPSSITAHSDKFEGFVPSLNRQARLPRDVPDVTAQSGTDSSQTRAQRPGRGPRRGPVRLPLAVFRNSSRMRPSSDRIREEFGNPATEAGYLRRVPLRLAGDLRAAATVVAAPDRRACSIGTSPWMRPASR